MSCSNRANHALKIDRKTFERCRPYLSVAQHFSLEMLRDKIDRFEEQLAALHTQVDAMSTTNIALAALRSEAKKKSADGDWSDSEDEQTAAAILSINRPNIDVFIDRAVQRIRSLTLMANATRELAATMEQALPETRLSPRISSARQRSSNDFLRDSPTRRSSDSTAHFPNSEEKSDAKRVLCKSKSAKSLWKSPFRFSNSTKKSKD